MPLQDTPYGNGLQLCLVPFFRLGKVHETLSKMTDNKKRKGALRLIFEVGVSNDHRTPPAVKCVELYVAPLRFLFIAMQRLEHSHSPQCNLQTERQV